MGSLSVFVTRREVMAGRLRGISFVKSTQWIPLSLIVLYTLDTSAFGVTPADSGTESPLLNGEQDGVHPFQDAAPQQVKTTISLRTDKSADAKALRSLKEATGGSKVKSTTKNPLSRIKYRHFADRLSALTSTEHETKTPPKFHDSGAWKRKWLSHLKGATPLKKLQEHMNTRHKGLDQSQERHSVTRSCSEVPSVHLRRSGNNAVSSDDLHHVPQGTNGTHDKPSDPVGRSIQNTHTAAGLVGLPKEEFVGSQEAVPRFEDLYLDYGERARLDGETIVKSDKSDVLGADHVVQSTLGYKPQQQQDIKDAGLTDASNQPAATNSLESFLKHSAVLPNPSKSRTPRQVATKQPAAGASFTRSQAELLKDCPPLKGEIPKGSNFVRRIDVVPRQNSSFGAIQEFMDADGFAFLNAADTSQRTSNKKRLQYSIRLEGKAPSNRRREPSPTVADDPPRVFEGSRLPAERHSSIFPGASQSKHKLMNRVFSLPPLRHPTIDSTALLSTLTDQYPTVSEPSRPPAERHSSVLPRGSRYKYKPVSGVSSLSTRRRQTVRSPKPPSTPADQYLEVSEHSRRPTEKTFTVPAGSLRRRWVLNGGPPLPRSVRLTGRSPKPLSTLTDHHPEVREPSRHSADRTYVVPAGPERSNGTLNRDASLRRRPTAGSKVRGSTIGSVVRGPLQTTLHPVPFKAQEGDKTFTFEGFGQSLPPSSASSLLSNDSVFVFDLNDSITGKGMPLTQPRKRLPVVTLEVPEHPPMPRINTNKKPYMSRHTVV